MTEQNYVYNQPAKWDYVADVLIVGTGTSMHGAIKLADSGLKVIAIDANEFPGGATVFSGGGAYLPLNKFSVKHGDTKAKCMTYLTKQKREVPIGEDVIESYIGNSNPMMEYMATIFKDYGLYPTPGGTELFGDYHAEWDGGRADA
ncbi:FAD-binding protein [Lactobacillus sp. ESL0684]|uniref:FAD-binding protein n=1 Tax=Lactobacillus sp. ESL0684 TaxID=2983213 RepID=UPI0023F8F9C8|nr:FAD-binding protein [Lactobacillus sp. ESL0684]WEV43839.1 FAD-binding protein [Lactobacillus sp. ESL0684]